MTAFHPSFGKKENGTETLSISRQKKHMEIIVRDSGQIFALQEAFSSLFPYLKLEFFSQTSKKVVAATKNKSAQLNKKLAEYKPVKLPASIVISGTSTVKELEKQFAELYGLGVQVLRKSGNMWLETSITDSWTLEKQNAEGESFSNYLAANKIKIQKDS
jgi:hypothetical protein